MEEMPQMDEPVPDQGGDMGGPQPHVPEPPQDFPMHQLLERFDRLEARTSRIEDFQAQMMALLQQNADATARIEDKLSHLK